MGVVVHFPQTRTGRFVHIFPMTNLTGQRAYAHPALAEWTTWMRAQGQSESTIEARVRRIELMAATTGCDPRWATTDDVVNYMASLPARMLKSTRATYYSHIRAWFAWVVVTMQWRDDDPCVRVPAPKQPRREPRAITDEQLDRVLNARMHKRTRMMVYLAAFQGLRAHEIAKIRGEDVDLLAHQLTVRGKGGGERTIELHTVVAQYAADFPRRGWWFPSHKEGREDLPILSRSVSDMVGDVMRRAGVSKGGPHRLRHTFATRLVRSEVNLRVVQELLRHASLQTTQIYTGVTLEQQRSALASLGMPSRPVEPAKEKEPAA